MPQVAEQSDHMFQAYGIFLFENKHSLIKQLRKEYTPSIHGHKTWNSSFLLMDYFLHKHLLKNDLQVMELGCGWGPASIFCAENAGCQVTGVDLDDQVFPFLETQAALNDVEVQTKKQSFDKLTKKELQTFDLVFGADVCFWDQLAKIHYNLIKRAFAAGVKDIVFADPGRSPFFDLAEWCDKKFHTECLEWYSTEPEKFEGYILHVRNL